MIDLWKFFVEDIFGSFGMAVMALTFAQMIMLAWAGVSAYSIGIFIGMFFLAMALGYGYMVITIPLVTMIISWSLFQIIQYWNDK